MIHPKTEMHKPYHRRHVHWWVLGILAAVGYLGAALTAGSAVSDFVRFGGFVFLMLTIANILSNAWKGIREARSKR